MAYLGNAPARSFISFERQVFTIVNSQTAYTLSHSVNNENDLRLVINNIVQEPGSGKAYTASGTTLTLSAALTNGTDEMYCVFLGRAVATNKPGAGSVGTTELAADAVTEAKIADDAVESEHLNDNVISGQTALGATPADTDELLISDAGTLKRVDFSYLKGGVNTPVVSAIRFGTTQSISATTWTRIVFNSERLDTGSIYDNSTGVATITEAGKYLVMTTIGVRNLTGSSEYFGAAIQNTDRTQAGVDSIAAYVSGASGYGWKNIHLSQIKSYSVNDTIAIYCYATEAVDLVDESQNLTICKIIE
jgi:hypothetical protein